MIASFPTSNHSYFETVQNQLFAYLVIFHTFFRHLPIFFTSKILSGIPSVSAWIQIRRDILSCLIWVQIVCKSYQQTTLVGIELIVYKLDQ